MQIIMSPAKLMDFDTREENIKTTKPIFSEKSEEILEVCKKLSEIDIAEKMKVNCDIAQKVYGYFQSFNFKTTPLRAAALAYDGIAYKGLNAHDFSKEDIAFAQKHLNILSGFYGTLKPFDQIKPYRLEFSRKIQPNGYKDLYDFWQNEVNQYLAGRLTKDEKVIINVASKEYSKVVSKKLLPKGTQIIEINFLQQEGNELKQIVVHSKKARGLMARFIIKNQLKIAEEVKAFDYENYFYYPQLSTNDKWVFVR
ncbi:MAG: YaaA family protein [Bacteroidia bacterium]|nr:YaaA family protein [Bacteroidia bacterium]